VLRSRPQGSDLTIIILHLSGLGRLLQDDRVIEYTPTVAAVNSYQSPRESSVTEVISAQLAIL
jgi:hypothetical protein